MTETNELQTRALTVPEKARSVKIISNETYQAAGEILVEIKGLRKEINATFDPIIKKAYEAHKEAKAQKTRAETPLVQAENIIKPALAAWDTEQERIRIEAERKAQEAARKAEEDRKLAEAVALEQSGDNKSADQVMAEPVYIPPVVVAKTVPKVQGVSFTERWQFKITDQNAIPRQYMVPDTVKIGQVVRAMKGAVNIPGVQAYCEKVVFGRTGV